MFTGYVKYISLVVLTLQNAVLGLSMRYALKREGAKFSPPAGKKPLFLIFTPPLPMGGINSAKEIRE